MKAAKRHGFSSLGRAQLIQLKSKHGHSSRCLYKALFWSRQTVQAGAPSCMLSVLPDKGITSTMYTASAVVRQVLHWRLRAATQGKPRHMQPHCHCAQSLVHLYKASWQVSNDTSSAGPWQWPENVAVARLATAAGLRAGLS